MPPLIRGYCCQFNNHQQSTYALEKAKHRVLAFYQSCEVMITEYVEHFKALVSIVEMYNGTYKNKPELIKAQLTIQGVTAANLNNPYPAKLAKALKVCQEEYLSCIIL